VKTGKWEAIAFPLISRGMVFRLWEWQHPILIKDDEGNSVFVALCDAYLDPDQPCCADCHKVESEALKYWIQHENEGEQD
jgi:hypothetical protein